MEHTISYPTSTTMNIPDFTVAPGEYPYLLVIIDNKLMVKYEHETTKKELLGLNTVSTETTPHVGPNTPYSAGRGLTGDWSGYTLHQMTASNTYGSKEYKNGTIYIRSRGNKTTFSGQAHPDNIALGALPPEISDRGDRAEFDSEYILDLQDDDTKIGTTHGNYILEPDHTQGTGKVVLLNRKGEYATSIADAKRLAFAVMLSENKVVTKESTFVLDFRFSKSLSMDFDFDTGNKEVGCIKFGVNPVEILLQVTD
jgi:hypothetical protein